MSRAYGGGAMQNLPMDLLRTFIKAIDLGSLTRAAESVGRTQSAVSLQIRRLEEVADVALFKRDAHRLQLTPEGKQLAQYARRILALNDEALASMRRPDIEGRVRLGAPHEYTASLLPEFLGKFAQSHPNVMLEVTSDLTKNLLRRLQNGEFDLVIALHHESDKSGGNSIFTEAVVWIASADHTSHQRTPLPLVVAPPPCIYRDLMLRSLNQRSRPCRITYVSSSYNGIAAAVHSGLGVSVMTASTMPSGIMILDERHGFPSLGNLQVRLHREKPNPPLVIARLEEYISDSFAHTRVLGMLAGNSLAARAT